MFWLFLIHKQSLSEYVVTAIHMHFERNFYFRPSYGCHCEIWKPEFQVSKSFLTPLTSDTSMITYIVYHVHVHA